MSHVSPPGTNQYDLDHLLRMGAAAAQSGQRHAARSLFLALAREHPGDSRVWLGLAGVAASRNEQREALERVVALDPDNERARLALQRLASSEPALARPTPVLQETIASPAATPSVDEGADRGTQPQEQGAAPFPLLNLIAMGVILLLLATVGVLIGRALLDGQATPIATVAPILQPPVATASPLAAPSVVATEPAAAVGSPTPVLLAPTAASPVASIAPGTTALPAATAAPAPTTTLPLGTVIDRDGWSAVLLRPDYALPLDGTIGDLRPAGRFVLAVVAVSNNSPEPRVIPPDLFVLTDSAGRRYTPVPGASTAYLSLYERAQYGDLALEELFEGGSGMRSVPLLFDVPTDAVGLRLTVNGAGPAGWPIGEPAPDLAPSGP